jgi:hypothetical protein
MKGRMSRESILTRTTPVIDEWIEDEDKGECLAGVGVTLERS